MSVVVTLNVNSKINALVFRADDYEIDDEGNVAVLAAVDIPTPAAGAPDVWVELHRTIATVRDWSAVAIDPGDPADLIKQVERAVKGDAAAAPCEACAKREERLADSLRRQHREMVDIAAKQAKAPGNG